MTPTGLLSGRARRVLAPLSPRHRRWVGFLHSLPLDPDRLEPPVTAPGPDDFIICGSPRTGTTLLCAALFQPPSIVTVMEPWDGMRLPPADLFASLREEIASTGTLARGRLDVDVLEREGRARWCRDGDRPVEVGRSGDPLLGVKWPAYWRYLPMLPDTKFLVCLRHPVGTIGSYRRAGGRVGQGLQYDTAFNRTLNTTLRAATRDVALRRILLFDHVHERILPYLGGPNVLAVHYERWFQDPAGLLADIGAFLGRDVSHPPVRITRPLGRSALDPEELAQIRKRCRTAEALGYRLDELPAHEGVTP